MMVTSMAGNLSSSDDTSWMGRVPVLMKRGTEHSNGTVPVATFVAIVVAAACFQGQLENK